MRKPCLGVDLVEYKKARRFYAAHKNRLAGYFGPSEISLIRKSARPHESLAMLLAAKEAVFKSAGLPWMGSEGFRKISITPGKNQTLTFRLRGDFKKNIIRRPAPVLSFFKSRDYVIAECR